MNHLKDQAALDHSFEKIGQLLNDDGAVVFVGPSSSFTSENTQTIARKLGWTQAWYERGPTNTKGVFSFQDSPWKKMTVWEPLHLLRSCSDVFDFHFLDIKRLFVQHNLLPGVSIEPPFEVVYGRKKK